MEFKILKNVLSDECGLPEGSTLVLGVSGGADSLCMMDTLAHMNYHLVICHFDHGLRPESADEARHVEKLAREKRMDFLLGKADVQAFCREERLSLEEGARVSRYGFLFREAREVSASAVAVAHNADDQVETVLMHLLRGSGLAGLRGMKYRNTLPEWDEAIPLIRPLLGVWRCKILEYCLQHKLEPVEDRTNQDTTYFRNRLRHELIPLLETYNPQVKQLIWKMANNLAADEELLEKAVATAWEDSVHQEGIGWIALSRKAFESQNISLQRRILRRAIDRLRPGLRDVDFEAVERGRDLVFNRKGSGQAELAAGLRLYKTRTLLYLASLAEQLPTEDVPQLYETNPVLLAVPGRVELANGWLIESELIKDAARSSDFHSPDSFHSWLDVDRVHSPLEVRRSKPGDRFHPLGMEGHSIKLTDLWINEGIPKFQRTHWPLIASNQAVYWVPGVRTSEMVKITNTTRNILHLKCGRYS